MMVAQTPSTRTTQQRAAAAVTVLILVVCACGEAAPASAPTVTTSCGPISGVFVPTTVTPNGTHAATTFNVAAYLGIPYAAPPVGPLRWMPAIAAQCWSGTLNASTQPPECVQFTGDEGGQESCLFLNVFAPVPAPFGAARTTAPVPATTTRQAAQSPASVAGGAATLVWLYGGDNTYGSTTAYGAIHNLLPLIKAEHGDDIVVVTCNFRLGVWGFLALEELSAADPRGTSGNYAITDIQQVLKWVQSNIAAFGGDPARVTLIGQSSGATNINALMASPASRGLFRAGIALSGSPNITQDLASAEAQGRRVVGNTSCARLAAQSSSSREGPSSLLQCLRNLSIAELTAATPKLWDGGTDFPPAMPHFNDPGLTIVDGATVVSPLLEALKHNVVDAALVSTSMQCEMDIEEDPLSGPRTWTLAQFQSWVESKFAPWGTDVVTGLLGIYKPLAANVSPEYAYYTMESDMGDACGNVEIARARGAVPGGAPAYLGVNTQNPSSLFMLARYAAHLYDIVAASQTWGVYTPSAADQEYGALLRLLWLPLIRDGKMPDAGRGAWPAANATLGFPRSLSSYDIRVGGDGGARSAVRAARCDALRSWGFDERYWWVN